MARGARYPLRTREDLVSSCRAFGCPVTELTLTQPTHSNIQPVFEWWVMNLLQISAENITEAVTRKLERFGPDDTALYEGALRRAIFFESFKRITDLAQIPNVSMDDVSRPSTARVSEILSGLVNLYTFAMQQEAVVFDPLSKRLKHLDSKRDAAMETVDGLRDRHDQLMRNVELLAAQSVALENEREVSKKAVLELMQSVAEINGHIASLKAQEHEKQNRLASLRSETQSKTTELVHERSKLVTSPERLVKTEAQLESQLVNEKELFAQNEAAQRSARFSTKELDMALEDLGRLFPLLESFTPIIEQYKSDLARLIDFASTKASLEKKKARLGTLLAQSQDRYKLKHEEMREYEESLNEAITAALAAIDERDAQLERISKSTQTSRRVASEYHAKTLALQRRLASEKHNAHKEEQAGRALAHDISQAVADFALDIQKGIAGCNALMDEYGSFLRQLS